MGAKRYISKVEQMGYAIIKALGRVYLSFPLYVTLEPAVSGLTLKRTWDMKLALVKSSGISVLNLASSSPFESLRKKDLEVKNMVDPVDEHAVQQLKEFEGKKLKSTTKEGLDIDDEDGKKKLEELKAEYEPLTVAVGRGDGGGAG